MNNFFTDKEKMFTFKQLYVKYYAPFCLYAKRFIDNKETREDIVSDIFTNLWYKQEIFEWSQEMIVGYIKICIKNSCINYLKHQQYESAYIELMNTKAPLYETEPDSIYTLDELYSMLNKTLHKLPENYRIVFIESFFKGKKQEEIAHELNVSVKTIHRYKQKTIDILRQELADFLPILALLLNTPL